MDEGELGDVAPVKVPIVAPGFVVAGAGGDPYTGIQGGLTFSRGGVLSASTNSAGSSFVIGQGEGSLVLAATAPDGEGGATAVVGVSMGGDGRTTVSNANLITQVSFLGPEGPPPYIGGASQALYSSLTFAGDASIASQWAPATPNVFAQLLTIGCMRDDASGTISPGGGGNAVVSCFQGVEGMPGTNADPFAGVPLWPPILANVPAGFGFRGPALEINRASGKVTAPGGFSTYSPFLGNYPFVRDIAVNPPVAGGIGGLWHTNVPLVTVERTVNVAADRCSFTVCAFETGETNLTFNTVADELYPATPGTIHIIHNQNPVGADNMIVTLSIAIGSGGPFTPDPIAVAPTEYLFIYVLALPPTAPATALNWVVLTKVI